MGVRIQIIGSISIILAIAWFYVANETLSVLENLALADVPVPKKLKEFLEQAKDKADKGEGKE